MKLYGTVMYWSPDKHYGFIRARVPAAAGFVFEKFFLSERDITFSVRELEVRVGDFVRFRPGRPRSKPHEAVRAVDVEIFNDEEQCKLLDLVRNPRPVEPRPHVQGALAVLSSEARHDHEI
jgi:hypothetical protein